jgi:deoxyribodipyrimidine photo-lyase
MNKVAIFWFRRDLRLEDNCGLFQALGGENPVLPIFIFDPQILNRLNSKKDARVEFIHQAIQKIKNHLQTLGADILVLHQDPLSAFQHISTQYSIQSIYTNHDYERYGVERDLKISNWASDHGIVFQSFKDQVVFEKSELLSGQGTPYTVFTPYSRKWKERLAQEPIRTFGSELGQNYLKAEFLFPSLDDLGFESSGLDFPIDQVKDDLIRNYGAHRDFPALPGTSRLSVHLRFGTISVRSLVLRALGNSETWLNELIWRDFYFSILYHFPRVSEGKAFRKEYDLIEWRNDEKEFAAWCEGRTGYPLVDAGMRELNQTGFMHNRVRMVVASFLVKHLLIDWRWGEAYFAEKLLDFDFSANNGGWQWASGSGCDAAPYFRVFNPTLQMQKFDPQLEYVKKWVPEFLEFSYSKPIVDHNMARKRVVEVYQKALRS